jgi:hypothetical protein
VVSASKTLQMLPFYLAVTTYFGKVKDTNLTTSFPCIKEWSLVTNLCPLCKREFINLKKKKVGEKYLTLTLSLDRFVWWNGRNRERLMMA